MAEEGYPLPNSGLQADARFARAAEAEGVRPPAKTQAGKASSMQKDWRDLTYLLRGTATQQAAYHALEALRVFPLLSAFDPVLAGTIPPDVDVPGSDLDIVCYAEDVDTFAQC